jgi:hypothetical protein
VIAGETSQYARVVRLLANGALDDSFGRDGVVDSTLGLDPDIDWSGWGSWPSVSDVAMLADERIVLGGRDYAGETSVLVLTPSGVPDWSFGPDGLRKIDTGDGDRGPGASTARFAVSAAGIVAATSLGDAVTVARLNVDERPGASTVGFRATYAAAFEKNERFVQQVHRSGSSEGSISVNYRTVDGTATAPADYTTRRGVIVWQDGDREPKEIEIPLVTGDLAEDAERFDLVLEAPMSAGLAASMAHIDLYDPTPPVAQSPARPDTSPPASASGGGGALDHFSLALLVLLWSASQRRRPRPSIIDKWILP